MPATDAHPREVTHADPPAVIAAIDRAALLRLADRTGGFVDVVPVVGEYLAPGQVVLRISGTHTEPEPRLVRRVFVLARQRTVDQDPAFALRMLVDIAIRALSPAVNDPTTAVQVLDRIEALLVDLAGRHPGPSILVDDDGRVRARVSAPQVVGLRRARAHGDPPVRRGLAAGGAQAARRLRPAVARWPARASETVSTSSAGCSPKRSPSGSPTRRSAGSWSRRIGSGSASSAESDQRCDPG